MKNTMMKMNMIHQLENKLFSRISTKSITLLKDVNKKVTITKKGKYNNYCNNYITYNYKYFFELHNLDVFRFLSDLNSRRLYILSPILSIDGKVDQPYIVLSPQIIVSSYSDSILISKYISQKIENTFLLYNIGELERYNIIFKHKEIQLNLTNINKLTPYYYRIYC